LISLYQFNHAIDYSNSQVCDGQFEDGLPNGFSIISYSNGTCQIGFYQNNQKHGRIKILYENGKVEEGLYENDVLKDRVKDIESYDATNASIAQPLYLES